MTWQPLQLRGISFIGREGKEPALLRFRSGLNVICGASDTGKSFIVEAIDYLLGARDPLRDIPERIGYDRARLSLETVDADGQFTLQRSTTGGDFQKWDGDWLLSNPSSTGIILKAKHSENTNSLSSYLLQSLGLAGKRVKKSQAGDTQNLSFRNLSKLVVVQENSITKRGSPFLSEQRTSNTADYSVFKLLLTGLDDSALISYAQQQAEATNRQQSNAAKLEMLNEWLGELHEELNQIGITPTEAQNQLLELEATFEQQGHIIRQAQSNLNERMQIRRSILDEQQSFLDRIAEINGLLSRFQLLQRHYQIDIERLEAIQESGTLFVLLDHAPCPLCGSPPEEQHYQEVCDGNVEQNIEAARAEISKISKLLIDLEDTVIDLENELEEVTARKEELDPRIQSLTQEIQDILAPALGNAEASLNELLGRSNQLQKVIDVSYRIEHLEEKRLNLLETSETLSNLAVPTIDLSKSVLDAFSQKVQHLLQTWGFPNCDRVHFDESDKDIVINGQLRTSRGKGLRAITHAAMSIGLMEFCRERNLPHPGFVVLDSPLLAYYEPEGVADSLEGTDLKIRFYEYLANNHNDSQIIIVENEHPPESTTEKIELTIFTRNPERGRFGFFPVPS